MVTPESGLLYHWTCAHAAPDIRREVLVRPHMGYSWWTDLSLRSRRNRLALGLTQRVTPCDRMEYRCTPSTTADLVPWEAAAAANMRDWADQLRSAAGADPTHWWVATVAIPIRSVRWMGGPRR